jgi:hypothetical protein
MTRLKAGKEDGVPLYEYQCVDCTERNQRIAGLDDHVAICASCGGLMLRLNKDHFPPYFAVPIMSLREKDDAEKFGV